MFQDQTNVFNAANAAAEEENLRAFRAQMASARANAQDATPSAATETAMRIANGCIIAAKVGLGVGVLCGTVAVIGVIGRAVGRAVTGAPSA